MTEYIDRAAAVRILEAKSDMEVCTDAQPYFMAAAKMIGLLPSADVAQVRHGRWICIRKGYGEYECSVCHGVDTDCSDYYGTHVVTEQDYCPNCGSRMDGDDDE